eukprot:scaffold913_cov233-Pinguiococcus_pyrenoidosus.AAC.9
MHLGGRGRLVAHLALNLVQKRFHLIPRVLCSCRFRFRLDPLRFEGARVAEVLFLALFQLPGDPWIGREAEWHFACLQLQRYVVLVRDHGGSADLGKRADVQSEIALELHGTWALVIPVLWGLHLRRPAERRRPGSSRMVLQPDLHIPAILCAAGFLRLAKSHVQRPR